METRNKYLKRTNFDADLVNAVIDQFGDWESFSESAEDVMNHGIGGGFSGWIYYSETNDFYQDNQELIRNLVITDADMLGLDPLLMVQGFNCLGDDYSLTEIGQTLFSSDEQEHQTQVANALAWFAAEEVCRDFADV